MYCSSSIAILFIDSFGLVSRSERPNFSGYGRCTKDSVPKTQILMGHYSDSLSVDAKIMISKHHPIIGEHVTIILFLTKAFTIATV